MPFDYDLDFASIDFRARPDLYRVGRGEQGVLLVEPYKSELLPLWRFRTPELARESAQALLAAFDGYRDAGDFVGMDMARKYIQMGYTRARRYANHRGGRKYHPQTGEPLPLEPDPVKAESAAVFAQALAVVKADAVYQAAKAGHIQRYGK
jgi:hypothetical protein